MKNKTYLVARREYFENMRTKAFWIGILSFPVILAAGILLPAWLEKKKDARTYTVIDESGWLLEAVEERANGPDFKKVLDAALKDRAKGKGLEKYPPEVRALLPSIEEAARKQENLLEEISEALFQIREVEEADLESIKPFFTDEHLEEVKRFLAAGQAIRSWWENLGPEEAARLSSGLNRAKYHHIEFDDLGENSEDALKKKVDREELFAYFVIGEDPVDSSEGCKYVSNNLTDDDLRNWFSRLATDVIREKRIAKEKIDPVVMAKIQEPLKFAEKKVTAEGEIAEVEKLDQARQWAPMVFVYLLWISVFTSAQMLLTNTIEEKSNRIIEVLLSSVSPVQLMTGKILGIAATGLTVVGSWAAFFLVGVKLAPKLLGAPAGLLDQIAQDPVFLISFLCYFLLGFLLYAALLVSFGSVCNSLKEAQNLMQPVFIVLIVPLIAMFPITRDPNGPLAKFLTYIPPFTPFVMMNRAAGPPSVLEYVLSTALLIAFTLLMFWGAAKVFRIGILMTGKPPKIGEIIRWIRVPVGTVPESK